MDQKVEEFMNGLNITAEIRNGIEEETRDQSVSLSWTRVREKKITASSCHRVISYTGRASPKNVVKDIIRSRSFSTAATRYGLENEEHARDTYAEGIRNTGATVLRSGFCICPNKGFIGASPDAIILQTNGQKGLLEIKCPFKYRNATIEEAVQSKDSNYPIKKIDGINQLKKTHQYYHQIQMQLLVCEDFADYCIFMVYHADKKCQFVQRIEKDDNWTTQNVRKMTNFYREHVVREILG